MKNHIEALKRAKKNKNDEFYTRYEDIEEELRHYKEVFKDQVIYCPCDDYRWSNFVKWFKDKFSDLGIRKLYATNYDIGEGAYIYEYDGKEEKIEVWQGAGGYQEHGDILVNSDIVVTNPPFSLLRDFIDWIGDKRFIIIAPKNALQYTNVFKLIKEGRACSGISRPRHFGKRMEGLTRWLVKDCGGLFLWINTEDRKRTEELALTKSYYEHPEDYPKYDNYDAINCDRVKDIPYDYEGYIGVPVTFLDGYREGYEIVDLNNRPSLPPPERQRYNRAIIKRKEQVPKDTDQKKK